jgi:gamma-glutamylputrescine oxidase
MAFEGGRIIRERVAKYNIQCDLKDGGVFAAITAKQMGHLESQNTTVGAFWSHAT